MKYLKKFNESSDEDLDMKFISEVEEFTKENLAYLDDITPLRISFLENRFNMGVLITFIDTVNTVKWDDISDYIINYYDILKDIYYLDNTDGILDVTYHSGSGKLDIRSGELFDNIVFDDDDNPLDALRSIKIKFDNRKVQYGDILVVDLENFKK